MAEKISSGLNLTTDYFMRNFYRDNRDASNRNGRLSYSKIELSFEDSRALSHASKRMLASSFSDENDDNDIDDTTKSKIEAFVNTYNNALDSADTDNFETDKAIQKMKNLVRQYSDDLKEIGITTGKGGKLEINDELLKISNNSKVRKLFSDESEFSKKSLSLAKQLNSAVQNDLFSQMSGNGLRVNITI